MFGLFKKKYPLMTEDMIKPPDLKISTTEAKKLFKQFMKDLGYLERDELSEHASYLSDEIKDHEQYLREEVADKKDDLTEMAKQISQLNKKIKSADESSAPDMQDELLSLEEDKAIIQEELSEAKSELKSFKEDKKSFLIEYINSQTQSK